MGTAARRMDGDDLFDRIGSFLAMHGLSPAPEHYGFAYVALTDPEGPIGSAVAHLTEAGVRMRREDIEALGGTVSSALPPVQRRDIGRDAAGEALVTETQAQVEGFAEMMRTMHDTTRGFGADLAASAAAIERAPRIAGLDEIARITGAMMARVRQAEVELAQAAEETEALRTKLAEARDTARRDALTGLPNRRAFDEAFAAIDPDAGPWCVALVDIDRFKRINDRHGHAVGDRVLGAIGRTLAEQCRDHLVVRHGGEEFAVLLQGVALADAAALLDDARAVVAAKRFRSRETGEPLGEITFSAGITAVHDDDGAGDALARADRLLYAAKAGGRDRVGAA